MQIHTFFLACSFSSSLPFLRTHRLHWLDIIHTFRKTAKHTCQQAHKGICPPSCAIHDPQRLRKNTASYHWSWHKLRLSPDRLLLLQRNFFSTVKFWPTSLWMISETEQANGRVGCINQNLCTDCTGGRLYPKRVGHRQYIGTTCSRRTFCFWVVLPY